ncbi:MAG: AMP-binding protein, partial [Candidatus Binatia bacterium]
VWRDRSWSYAELEERFWRFARALARRGVGCRRERAELEPWESGQDAVALYLHNGNEYLEAMLGALAARATAVNVNYRYVANELAYLLKNSAAKVLVFHATFAPTVAKVRAELPDLEVLVQVPDDTGEPLLDGAIAWDDFVRAESGAPLELPRSGDDLFVIYTGGTTGLPKGVLWRQEDIFFNLFGGHLPGFERLDTLEKLEAHVGMGIGGKIIVAMPFMHGAGLGACFNTWHRGGTVVLPDEKRRLDPESYWSAVERHGVDSLMLIGDAFALPLADALRRNRWDLSSVRIVTSTAAVLSATAKADLLAGLPEHVMVIESVGSTETGLTAMSTLLGADAARDTSYDMRAGTVLLSADQSRILDPAKDRGEIGWTARTGELPLGYLGDAAKTRETFITLDGARYAIAGDRARYDGEGKLVLLGRESTCVNTGGEKVYVEEVERVVKTHPAILDALVVGRPSERWGQEVTAVVSLREGEGAPTVDALRAHCAPHLAGYKLPRAIVVAPAIVPLANGKPDYAWAKEVARSCSRIATPN